MSLRLDNSRLGKKVINHFSAGFCLHIQSPKVVINSLVYRNFTSLFIFPECRAFQKRWQKKNTPSSDAFFLLACRRDSTGTDFQHPHTAAYYIMSKEMSSLTWMCGDPRRCTSSALSLEYLWLVADCMASTASRQRLMESPGGARDGDITCELMRSNSLRNCDETMTEREEEKDGGEIWNICCTSSFACLVLGILFRASARN